LPSRQGRQAHQHVSQVRPGFDAQPLARGPEAEEHGRRAAFKDTVATLEAGRGAGRHQQRQLLIKAVKEKDRGRGLF
jgi:hypothetical protein